MGPLFECVGGHGASERRERRWRKRRRRRKRWRRKRIISKRERERERWRRQSKRRRVALDCGRMGKRGVKRRFFCLWPVDAHH